MKKKSVYHLTEISKWKEDNLVSLPKVQRSFVWKPYQIENLWDSLLRGFPIGSFVLSANKQKVSSKDAQFEILDGQQRVTSIMLGFGKETFRESNKCFRVFIDLHPPEKNDSRKYVFRLISRSHPWGYKWKDNTKTLIADDIRKALEVYNVPDYLKADLEDFYPFDAKLPVPFEYFVKFDNPNDLLKELKKWKHWNKIVNTWLNKNKDQTSDTRAGSEKSKLLNERAISERIVSLHTSVIQMLSGDDGQRVPILYLDFDKFRNEPKEEVEEEVVAENENLMDTDEDDANEEDEIENLFIRLNSGGTPLRGEDLNYSMLKAKFDWRIQDEIEKKCKGLFNPSRFITIAYRLYQHRNNSPDKLPFNMRIKPKDFQQSIENETFEFQEFIFSLINDAKHDGNLTLLEYVMKLLKFDSKKLNYGLPFLIVSKISESAPELMFLLLYRILYKKDRFEPGSDLHRRMLGIMTLFMWLGRGEGNRDHSKLLRNIWPCAANLPLDSFWSNNTVERAQLFDVLKPPPDFRSLKKTITNVKPRIDTRINKKFSDIEFFINMILKSNRDLVLYSQRKFLSEFFEEEVFHLDDTNQPFDWDHIFPHDLIKHKQNMHPIIKDWFSTIGNFRAWPYSMNRIDQNKCPKDKFHPPTDNHMRKIMSKWNLKTDSKLHKSLREWSFCDKEFADCSIEDVRKEWKDVFVLIRDRNLKICKTWYDELLIDNILPDSSGKKFSFDSMMNSDCWMDFNEQPDISKLRNPDKSQKGIISIPYQLGSSNISYYFLFDEIRRDVLENKVEFGIVERSNRSARHLKNFEKSDRHNIKSFSKATLHIIEDTFELISHDEYSYTQLMLECKRWLMSLSNKSVKCFSDEFAKCLSIPYQQRLDEFEKLPE